MGHTSAQEALRAVLAAAGSTALATALAAQLPDHLQAASGGRAAVDVLVLAAVVLVGAAAATALAVGCWAILLGAVARTTGHRAAALERVAAALTPAVLRRVVAAGVGVGLGLAGTTTASAVETDLGWVPTATTATAAAASTNDTPTPLALGPAPAPERQSAPQALREPGPESSLHPGVTTTPTSAPSAPGPTTPSGAPGATTLTVRPGDTLWDLAAAHLGGSATAASVQAAWPRWYAANRDVIGGDPDVLLPGQVLTVPSGEPVVNSAAATTDGVDR
nr:LysM peptidoglycan-binding domain-containing protein [uncultured Actinotalea sp.]